MSKDFSVAIRKETSFEMALIQSDYQVVAFGENSWQVTGDNEGAIFVTLEGDLLIFEGFICPVCAIDDKEILLKVLDLNTEIHPAAYGIDSEGEEPQLVIIASSDIKDLCVNELLNLVQSVELAMVKAESFLQMTV